MSLHDPRASAKSIGSDKLVITLCNAPWRHDLLDELNGVHQFRFANRERFSSAKQLNSEHNSIELLFECGGKPITPNRVHHALWTLNACMCLITLTWLNAPDPKEIRRTRAESYTLRTSGEVFTMVRKALVR